MKSLTLVLLVLALTACLPQSKTNNIKKSAGSGSQANTFFSTNGAGSGTGTSSDLDPDLEIGTGPGVVVTPTPTPVPTPELTEYCGKLYISKSNYVIFIDEDEHYRVLDPDSYNADQVINNINFPDDAFNACVHGDLTSGTWIPVLKAQYIQLAEAIVHPERETRKGSYSYEVCGTIMYKTDPGQTSAWIQIQVGTSYKIVDDPTNTVKNYLDAHGTSKGCLYNNAGYTSNTYVTFKKYFRPLAFDLGW